MTATEQSDEQSVDHDLLTDDDSTDLLTDSREGGLYRGDAGFDF